MCVPIPCQGFYHNRKSLIYPTIPARRCRAVFFGVGRRKPDNPFILLGYRPEQIWRHRGEKRCRFQRPNLPGPCFAPPAFAAGTFLTLLWKSAHRPTTRLTRGLSQSIRYNGCGARNRAPHGFSLISANQFLTLSRRQWTGSPPRALVG